MSSQNNLPRSESVYGALKPEIMRSFNQAASSYDNAALLQNVIGERLLERLDLVKIDPKTILDLGSATGVYSTALQKRYKSASVIGADIAWNMGAYALKQRKWFAKQRYICADAEALPFKDKSFDLVFSNLMLYWVNDPDKLFYEMQRILKPGGLIVFTTFGPDTLKEMRQSWAEVDNQVHVNRFMDMHDVGDSLSKSGFEGVVMDNENITLNYDQLADLHQDLKKLGEVNINNGRHTGLMGKARWKSYLDAYQQFTTAEGELPASWEVIYGHAWSTDKMVPLSTNNADFLGDIKITAL
jgi:malonyl-CoA O-methyltransferase